jgi:hypothetical protein
MKAVIVFMTFISTIPLACPHVQMSTKSTFHILKLYSCHNGLWAAAHCLTKEFHKLGRLHLWKTLGGAVFNGDGFEGFTPNTNNSDLAKLIDLFALPQPLAFFTGIEDIARLKK